MKHANTQDALRTKRPVETSTASCHEERFKRPRYTAQACKECKRRKVRCDGKTPCRHCKRYEVQCLYPTKNVSGKAELSLDVEVIKEKLETLQRQLSALSGRDSRSVQEEPDRPLWKSASICLPQPNHISPSPALVSQLLVGHSPNLAESQCGTADPTRSRCTMNLADISSITPYSASLKPTLAPPGGLAVTSHPLLAISQTEAMRLIDVYEDECGSVYPLIEIANLRCFTTIFYDDVKTSLNPATWDTFQVDQSAKESFHTLEIVVAIALVIEGRGSSDLGSALVDELETEVDHRPSGVSVDIPFAKILTLMSLYQFYRDEDVLAWRTIGLAARIALELGLHLLDPPFTTFQSIQEREQANRLFWCIYCLDKRWSLGTGLPFGIHEGDIDPGLPEPNDPHPYLFTSMIAYSKIGSQILKASTGVNHLGSFGAKEDVAFLTYRVQQWYSSLDPELRIELGQELVLETQSPARNRLRVLHYLRNNQLRMLIYRGAFFTASSIATDPRSARTAVDVARDTITLLDKLCSTSDIYSSHPVCFNYFLYSALIVILLAAHRAQAQFHEYCREEFHMALNLIGRISTKSSVAKKLRKIIRHLKVMGPETDMLPYMETQQEESRQRQSAQIGVHRSANQVSGDTVTNSTQASLNANAVNGLSNSLPYVDSGFYTGGHDVDASLLSSELLDLFRSMDGTEFESMPAQVIDAVPTFQVPYDFPRSVWSVL